MTNTQAIILGLVQGLTEYLPVSSSAHLVLVPKLAGWHIMPEDAFIFNILVQLGTLCGVFVYFFQPLKDVAICVLNGIRIGKPFYNENARLGWFVVLATIPAAVIGFLFKNVLSLYFSSPLTSCYFLICTGIILLISEYVARASKETLNGKDAFIIGCAQTLALFPGVSRSGATIAAGMACGLQRKNAARFSFLMSIPVLLGASLIAFLDLIRDHAAVGRLVIPLALGFLAAAISGFLVIRWFMTFLGTRSLTWFSLYCFLVGFLGMLFFSA